MDTLIDWGSLLIQFINFAIIAFVLRKYFFVPYTKFLDEEAKKRVSLEEQIAKSEHIVQDAHNQADNIIDQAKVDAKIIASEIVENAHKEASEIVTRAQIDADAARSKGFADIAHERKMIAEELKVKVVEIALKMNEKLFGKNEANVDFIKNSAHTIQL
jgi:F-type H+-transporting ATPase subunit b